MYTQSLVKSHILLRKLERKHNLCLRTGELTLDLDTMTIEDNKNAFQSKAHLPLANRKSNTYNLTLK